MKKVVVLILCLFLITPIASAFSFSEFFSNLFGSEDSVTGAAVGAKCNAKLPCGKGETCSRGKCVSSVVCGNSKVESGETCDGNSQSCITNGYAGSQSCNSACNGWNSCVASENCGDGTLNGNEVCDDGGSNTDTACTAEYGGSCTYCTTSCSSVIVQGGSCGDGICQTNEQLTGSFCDTDCFLYEEEPTVSISGIPHGGFGSNFVDIIVTISNSIHCSITILEKDYEESTSRRAMAAFEKSLVQIPDVECDSVESIAENRLNQYSGKDLILKIDAFNNQGKGTAEESISILKGDCYISNDYDPEGIYYTANLPSIDFSMASGLSRCSWRTNTGSTHSIDSCKGGTMSLSTEDLVDGVNYVTITAGDNICDSTTVFFIETESFLGETVIIEEGERVSGDGLGVTLGGLDVSAAAEIAVYAAKKNIAVAKGMSMADKLKIENTLLDESVREEIQSLSLSSGLTLSAIPVVRLNVLKKGGDYSTKLNLFESKKLAVNNYETSVDPITHEIVVTNLGNWERIELEIFSDPITVILALGECSNVDINSDDLADVFVCYLESGELTVDNIVTVNEEITQEAINPETTIINPLTITTVKQYSVPFDEELFEKELLQKYAPYALVVTAIVLVLLVLNIKNYLLKTKRTKSYKKSKIKKK